MFSLILGTSDYWWMETQFQGTTGSQRIGMLACPRILFTATAASSIYFTDRIAVGYGVPQNIVEEKPELGMVRGLQKRL